MVLSLGASAATTTTSVNNSQIGQAAGNVKHTVEKNYTLPNTVKVGNASVSEPQFLYLLTAATKNIYNGKTSSSVVIKNVSPVTTASETLTKGSLTKKEYFSIASSVNSYILTHGRIPSVASTSLGKMKYQNLIYMYSKIMAYYNVKKVLPTSVSVNTWYATTLGPSGSLNGTYKVQKKLGTTSYGYVNLIAPYGTGKINIAIILGVHPQEVQTHIAMWNAISSLSASLKNVKIWVFQVVVTKDVSNYSLGRQHGQDLAKAYVVPYITTHPFKLVMDVHGNRGNYYVNNKLVTNSMFAPTSLASSKTYSSNIIKNTNGDLISYVIAEGTSPKYVTIPTAAKGIPSVVYEQYLNQANYAKVLYNHSLIVLQSINKIFA